jgi:hypothetical protein
LRLGASSLFVTGSGRRRCLSEVIGDRVVAEKLLLVVDVEQRDLVTLSPHAWSRE